MPSIPVVMIGLNPVMVSRARDMLLPDYDMIHAMLSVDQAIADLPFVLANPPKEPRNTGENIGSKNFSDRNVVGVVVGGGISDEQFKGIKEASGDLGEHVLWIRPDMSKISGMPPFTDADAFGKEIGRRVKAKLNEVVDSGAKSGVHYWQ